MAHYHCISSGKDQFLCSCESWASSSPRSQLDIPNQNRQALDSLFSVTADGITNDTMSHQSKNGSYMHHTTDSELGSDLLLLETVLSDEGVRSENDDFHIFLKDTMTSEDDNNLCDFYGNTIFQAVDDIPNDFVSSSVFDDIGNPRKLESFIAMISTQRRDEHTASPVCVGVPSDSFAFSPLKSKAQNNDQSDAAFGTKFTSKILSTPLPSQCRELQAIDHKTERQHLSTPSICTDGDKKQRGFRSYQAKNWLAMFKQFCNFRDEHSHSLVPHYYEHNTQLSNWVKRQRRQYKLLQEGKKSAMTLDRIDKLERCGFVWDSHEVAWDARLADLCMFKEEHGHCDVPCTYWKNHKLSVWVKRQRRQHRLYCQGEPSSMTADRIVRLSQLGFSWELRRASSATGSE